MILIICPGCNHKVVAVKFGRKKPRCTLCGCGDAVIYRRMKVWQDTSDNPRSPEEARIATLAGLLWDAAERGYKLASARWKWKELYGAWPQIDPPPEVPSIALVVWLQRGRARHAARMRKLDGRVRQVLKPEPPSALMNRQDLEVDL